MRLLEPATLTRLNQLLVGSSVLLGVCVIGLSIRGVLAQIESSTATGDIRTNRRNLDELRNSLRKAPKDQLTSKAGKEIVIDFQRMAQTAAQFHKVNLNFDQVGDDQVFISKYSPEAAPEWKQVEIMMTVQGTTGNVLALIDEFQTFPVPCELGDFEMNRGMLGRSDGVTAKFGVKVLIRA